MTKEELREHCEKQVKMCEEWAKGNNREPSGKTYEEHKLVLELIKASEQSTSDDCVSRQAVLDCLTATGLKKFDFILDAREKVNNLSSVIPTQGTCKDCEQSQCLGEECYCNNVDEYFDKEFYCADFKRRE